MKISLTSIGRLAVVATLSCGAVGCSSQIAEGVRVMAGKGGTHETRNTIEEMAPIARDLASYQPHPRWEHIVHAEEADLVLQCDSERVLVGLVQLSSATADLSYGNLLMLDLRSGTPLWEVPRRSLKNGGKYAVLAQRPLLVVEGVTSDETIYSGIDWGTGATRWEQVFRQPNRAVIDEDRNLLIVVDSTGGGREVVGVGLQDGRVSWRVMLDATETSSTAPVLTMRGDQLVVAFGAIHAIDLGAAQLRWTQPLPSGMASLRILPTARGWLVSDEARVVLVSSSDGKIVWGPFAPGGTIGAVSPQMPRDETILLAIQDRQDEELPEANYTLALNPRTGSELWRTKVPGQVRSRFLCIHDTIYLTTPGAFVALNAKTGAISATVPFPVGATSWGNQLPDVVMVRNGRIFVGRENSGVACFSPAGPTLLWHQGPNMGDNGKQRYQSRMYALQQTIAAGTAAQREGTSNTAWWNNVNRSVEQQWQRMLTDGDPSLTDSEREQSAWRDPMYGAMMVSLAMMALADGIRGAIAVSALNALEEKLILEVSRSVHTHFNSFTGKYYIRSFGYHGRGVTIVDLDTGERVDLEYGAPSYGIEVFGINLDSYVLDPDAGRLVAFGVGLDPSRYEKYVKFKWGLPYPSVLSFKFSDLTFRKQIWDDSDVPAYASAGDLAGVKKQVERGAWVDSRDVLGDTGLAEAAANGHTEIVRFLLDKGAAINHAGYLGHTAISLAAFGGHRETVAELLRRGADTNLKNSLGETALDRAQLNGHQATAQLLKSAGAVSGRTAKPE